MVSPEYRSIAAIVFEQALKHPEDRFAQILRLLKQLDLDYSSDLFAFNHFCRAENVIEAFVSVDLGRAFYKELEDLMPSNSYVWHQSGVFELRHTKGSLERAGVALSQALRITPYQEPEH